MIPCFVNVLHVSYLFTFALETITDLLTLFFPVAEGSSTSVIARGQCWTPGRVSVCRGWPTGRTANRSLLQVRHDQLIGACTVGFNDNFFVGTFEHFFGRI